MFETDTRKPNCPIRIVYAGPGIGPYHASELTERIYLPRDRPLAIIKCTEHSDYSGGGVEASNYRVMMAGQAEHVASGGGPVLVEIYGSHGYMALAYDATLGPVPPIDELCEMLEGIEDYALIDDDDHSRLETELETEAWNDYGRKDFRKALTALLDELDGCEHDLDPGEADTSPVTDRAIDHLWRTGCDAYNINGGVGFTVESGCNVHFYIAEWCERAKREPHGPSEHAARYGIDPVPSITELAYFTRV